MEGFLKLPVSLWGNVVSGYIGVHDLLSLRLVSHSYYRKVNLIIPIYFQNITRMYDQLNGNPLYQETKSKITLKLEDAHQVTSQIDERSFSSIKTYYSPPEGIAIIAQAILCFLNKPCGKDYWHTFAKIQFDEIISAFSSIREIPPNIGKVRAKLQNSRESDMQCVSSFAYKAFKFLSQICSIEELETEEYRHLKAAIIFVQQEKQICEKLLTRRNSS